jgi:nucleoside-diphosphate-sugar epimerase
MRILIVGGASSLGCALKPVLSAFAEVITAGKSGCDIKLDLRDPPGKMALPDGVDVVINTAAKFGGKTPQEILETADVNVLGVLRLCIAAVQAGVKHFVHLSSIYASLEKGAPNFGIYSMTKRHSEEIVEFFCSSHSLPLTILRPSPIYGDSGSFRKHQPFLYAMIDKAERGEPITIYGSNDARRNYIHVDDLAKIIARVVQLRVEGTYSCAHTRDVTFSQIARAAFSAFGHPAQTEFLKGKPDVPDNVFGLDDSLYKMIDYHPQMTIEEGMRRVAIYRKAAR